MSNETEMFDAGTLNSWRLIETAPKDSKDQILVWSPTAFRVGMRFLARWNDDKYAKNPRPFWDFVGQQITVSRSAQPTHWMPLPEPPLVGGRG